MDMQLIEGTKGRRHRLVSIFNNMQTAESLKMQSVMLGGVADPAAFMTEVAPFQYETFRCGFPSSQLLARPFLLNIRLTLHVCVPSYMVPCTRLYYCTLLLNGSLDL